MIDFRMKSQVAKKKFTGEKKNKVNGKSSVAKLKQSETSTKAPAAKRKFNQISPQLNEEIQSDSEAEQEK